MSEQKKPDIYGWNKVIQEMAGLDRPSRETIADYLWHLAKKGLPKVCDQHSLYLQPFLPLADELLALISEKPAIFKCGVCGGEMSVCLTEKDIAEDAKKQERERIRATGIHIIVGQVLELDGEKMKATKNQTLVLIPDEPEVLKEEPHQVGTFCLGANRGEPKGGC